MSDITCEDTLKLKQSIIDEGLYEEGMSVADMQKLSKTLNRSKKTANEENEYRELLSQTDLNCTQIELMKTQGEDLERTSDTDSVSIISVTPVKENFKNSKLKQTKSVDKNTEINFSFNTGDSHEPIMSIKRNKNVVPILYHHPAFLKLPIKKKSELIMLYLQHQLKQIKVKQYEPPVAWCKPLTSHPDCTFENEFSLDQDSELSQVVDNNVVENSESSSNDFIRKSKRRKVKRNIYEEIDSDDDFALSIKKTKSTVDSNKVNKNTESQDLNEPSTSKKWRSKKADSDEEYNPVINKKSKLHDDTVIVNKSTPTLKPIETVTKAKKWISNTINDMQTYSKTFFSPNVSDRTNKLFDKLKEDDNKKKPKENTVILDEIVDSNDSSEDIFPATKKTVANIHNEATPKLKKGKAAAKKTQTKPRKKLNLKTTNEEKQENNTTQIPTMNFYGRNKENEQDASNNNKITSSKMIQCPICFRSFPESEVEEHAGGCDQFDESKAESLCDICNKYVLNVDMDAHKFQCLENITENSVEKPYKPNVEYLCACGTYVVDGNQIEHANSCISVDDG